jgi:hypothetical protein
VIIQIGVDGGLQDLHDAKRAEAEVPPEDGEEAVEEYLRPADLGEEDHDDLEKYEDAVEDRDGGACGLVRDGAARDILKRAWCSCVGGERRVGTGFVRIDVGVYGLDVMDKRGDGAGKDEDAANNGEDTDNIEADEDVWA